MANKKAEILTMDGQVVSPITLATNVLLDDGRTAQDLLDSRDESMFSPTITTSSSISKVGQGDNVDFSENVIDGAYKSCVLKGKTLVNHNAEGNDRDEYVCMPSLEGSNLTVNGTVESKVKSAILKGNTLVNLVTNQYEIKPSWNTSKDCVTIGEKEVTIKLDDLTKSIAVNFNTHFLLKPNTKYIIVGNVTRTITETASNLTATYSVQWYKDNTYKGEAQLKAESRYRIFTTGDDFNILYVMCYARGFVGEVNYNFPMIFEYQDGMENWDIPYFEGMQSVKMPVLTTTGKNLFNINAYTSLKNNATIEGEWLILGENHQTSGSTWDVTLAPNTSYYVSDFIDSDITTNNSSGRFRVVDKMGNEILKLGGFNRLLTTTNESDYIFEISRGSSFVGSITKFKIQLEQGSHATSYEPFKSNILSTPEDVVLRSLPNGVCDTLDLMTAEYVQRIGEVVLDGSADESWKINSHVVPTDTNLISYVIKNEMTNFISPNFSTNANFQVIGLTTTVPGGTRHLVLTIEKSKLSTQDVVGLRTYLQQNPITVQYELATPVVKTVVLSDNVVYSYNDTTHYTCSSEEGSLLPTLAIEEGVKYKAIIKPSTKYSIVFNRAEVASGLTVDLGGATANVVSTAVGKTIVQITTLPTLSHNYVKFLGVGNAIKDVQVIEGDVADDVEYFEGMCDVEMPVVKNVGKNLFDFKNAQWLKGGNFNPTYGNSGNIVIENMSLKLSNPSSCVGTIVNELKPNTEYYVTAKVTNTSPMVINSGLSYGVNNTTINGGINRKLTTNSKGELAISIGVYRENTNGGYVLVENIQVEEGSVATSYEPYKSNILSFDQKDGKTIVLRSLPNGVCDTLNVETGEYVQRIGEIVLDNSDSAHVWNLNSDWSMGDVAVFWSNNVVKMTGSSILCDKFPSLHRNELIINNVAIKEAIRYGVASVQFFIRKSRLETPDVAGFKRWLSQNPATVQYELATPIITTIDLKQHPFAYKNGYVVLTSSSEEVSLTPTIEYSLIANRLGQIQTNQKLVEKQQTQIDELESMVITNLVNTQYQQALNEIKLGVK